MVFVNRGLWFGGLEVFWNVNDCDDFMLMLLYYVEFLNNIVVIMYLEVLFVIVDVILRNCLDESFMSCVFLVFN